ncbi:MAG: NAD-dependent deacylase [Longimicrobiales bacterium]|nr:NAD-dependent deacylase [Longimicrobiales bacterium]
MTGRDLEGGVARAREVLAAAGEIFVLTGAGISAESGVPTFRGEDGLWKNHRPEELATPGAFRRDPRLVWEWYGWRRGLISACEPNAGHRALAALAGSRPGVRIVTQNVDGLHTLAVREAVGPSGESADDPDESSGTHHDPTLPLELHGSLFRVRCTECSHQEEHRAEIDATSTETLPRCRKCGALLRPDVVWFGESLDPTVLDQAAEVARSADVALVVGTSAVVEPAASLPRLTASSGGTLIEVNPDETPLSSRTDVSLRGPAGSILPRLLRGEKV